MSRIYRGGPGEGPSMDPRRDLWDRYPRDADPMRAGGSMTTTSGPGVPPSTLNDPARSMQMTPDVFRAWRIRPKTRPIVYQKEIQFSVTSPDANGNAVPILPSPFQADAFLIDVPSTAANSMFYGANPGVNAASGIEIRPGLPQFFGTDNTRELWELQTALEDIGGLLSAMLAVMTGQPRVDPPDSFYAPRVVFNMGERYLFASASTTCSVTLFLVPELQ